MPKLLVLLILVVTLTIAGLAITNSSMSQFLTAFISLVALIVSTVSAFKDDIFPFRPRVVFDELVLLQPSGAIPNNPTLLLPITFLNEGHGAGVIEGLTLRVECGSTVKVYIPIVEIDYQKFISERHELHGDNTLCAFNAFSLGSREATKKSIVFVQEGNSPHYPFSTWSPGNYAFRLFMKHSGATSPVKVGTIENDIPAKLLADYNIGMSTSLCPSRELRV